MRNPWEIDWSDPAQAQQMSQRPRIQGPPRVPAPRYEDEAARSAYDAQRGPYQVQREQLGVERDRAELESLRRQQAAGPTAEATEGERLSYGFFERAMNAHRRYGEGVAPRGVIGQMAADIAPRGVVNSLTSPERQRAETYASEFVAATLRRESGAAIPPEELAEQRRRYFPMPGDTPETIESKRQLREAALESLRVQSGRLGGRRPEPETTTGAPPALGGERPTTTERRTMAPGAGGRMEVNDEVQTGTNPALAGLNAQIGQMIQQRRPVGQIVRYLRERGATPQALQALSVDLRRIQQFQRENPNYRGPFTVDLERYEMRLDPIASTVADVADSPVGAALISGGDTVTGGHLDNLVGLTGGDAELANLGIQESRSRHPYASLGGDIASGASLYGLGRAATSRLPAALVGRGGPATGAFSPGAIGGDAALGAYIGSGQSGTDPFDPASAGLGALAASGGGMAGRGAINTLGRAVSPTGGASAPLYREGVQPTIGQRVGGAVDRVEQAFTSVPIIGGVQRGARNQAVEQFQRGAFNQALRDIGLQLPNRVRPGTRAHLFSQRAFDREFRQIRSRAEFTPDNEFAQRFGEIMQDLETLPQDSQNIFRRMVEGDMASRLRAGGNRLSGNAYLRVASRLDRVARRNRNSANGDQQLAELLEGMSEAIDEAAARQTPGLADRLRSVRSGYRKLVVIEDAARRRGSGSGLFSPTQFDAAVQNIGGGLRSRAYLRGQAPMQDYAQAGLRLGDDLPNSGTADRFMGMGAPFVLGGLGYVNPMLLTPWAASTAATLPGIRKGVNAALAPNRPGMMGLRSQIQDRAYLGSLAGYPLIPGGSQ